MCHLKIPPKLTQPHNTLPEPKQHQRGPSSQPGKKRASTAASCALPRKRNGRSGDSVGLGPFSALRQSERENVGRNSSVELLPECFGARGAYGEGRLKRQHVASIRAQLHFKINWPLVHCFLLVLSANLCSFRTSCIQMFCLLSPKFAN